MNTSWSQCFYTQNKTQRHTITFKFYPENTVYIPMNVKVDVQNVLHAEQKIENILYTVKTLHRVTAHLVHFCCKVRIANYELPQPR